MDNKEKLERNSYLNLRRSKLKSIPKEVLEKQDSLEELDISGNSFTDFYSVIKDLKKLKKLKRLKINIFTQKQAKDIIDSLPNLEYLNGESVNDEISEDEKNISNNKKDRINNIQNNFPSVKIIDNNFQKVFEKLSEFFILNKNNTKEFQRIIDLFNKKCKELNIKENKNIIEKMTNKEIAKELQLNQLIYKELKKIKDDMDINNCKQDLIDKLINIMLENEIVKNKCNKILNGRKEVNISLNNSESKQNKKIKISVTNAKKSVKDNLLLLHKNKQGNETRENKSFSKNNFKKINFRNTSYEKGYRRLTYSERKVKRNLKFNTSTKKYSNKADLSELNDIPIFSNLFSKAKSEFDTVNIFDDINNSLILKENMNPRILNLNNLLDIISQIYKIRYNRLEKRKQGFYNKGNLEQDFYVYLKSKYGLKNLIIEWSISILSSIQSYYKTNGEVYLFALILKNELDENSIEILNKIKNTMNSILNIIYDYNINKINNIKRNKEFMNENEWKAISICLYNDDNYLKEKFITQVSEYINKLMKGKNIVQRLGKKILFEDFLNILIIFNMKLRKIFLHNLFVLFSKEDIKRKGIINPENFKQIIKNTGIIKNEQKIEELSNELIEIVDKEGTGQITFNDIVQCLDSIDLITEEGKIKFLDKISNMNF